MHVIISFIIGPMVDLVIDQGSMIYQCLIDDLIDGPNLFYEISLSSPSISLIVTFIDNCRFARDHDHDHCDQPIFDHDQCDLIVFAFLG